MNGKLRKYRRYSVLDGTLEISVPISLVKVSVSPEYLERHQCVVWAKEKRETLSLYHLEKNEESLKDIILKSKLQLLSDKNSIKQLGMYSSSNNNIEKYMSEDELVAEDTTIYVISCAFRHANETYIIYYVGNDKNKAEIKEHMLFVLDSVKFEEHNDFVSGIDIKETSSDKQVVTK